MKHAAAALRMRRATPARAPARALETWLMHGPAQVGHGPHAGAVAGMTDTSGSVAYVYPEITGYFLQWLAWRAQRGDDAAALRDRAARAQRWLKTWIAGEPPLTRLHFDGATSDWRNDAVFCFDLAMVLRGLASAAQAQLVTVDATLVAGVVRQLERLLGPDDAFEACVANAGAANLPARWSTLRGAFLAKAGAGIAAAARVLPEVPAHIGHAGRATFDASVIALREDSHLELHPLLYAFEGVLSWPEHPQFASNLRMVASQFAALLELGGEKGQLPEIIGTAANVMESARVDIIAQAIRVGSLLAAHRLPHPPNQLALARLRNCLANAVRPSGSVGFVLDARRTDCNAWAAMFADQALAFAGTVPELATRTCRDPLLV
ncbi:MAG TPA: hypothetical protein VIK97_04425 [Casimicrobiaceae bacterium]